MTVAATRIKAGVRCQTCRGSLEWNFLRAHYEHRKPPAAPHAVLVDRSTLPKGHDFDAIVRYVATSVHPAVSHIPCWDCGRPIPPGARCYRRIDARQDMPTVCEPCHEEMEALLYRRVKVACVCGELIKWENGGWTHEDGIVTRVGLAPCPTCSGAKSGCRRCLRTGAIQVDDHRATPKESD